MGSLGLVYIDLDHFKPVNDTQRHPVGDQLLQMFARRLERAVRPTNAVARLGGDEFAIALFGVREASNAHAVAEKVLAAASEPVSIEGLNLQIGASVGVAYSDGTMAWRDVGKQADERLYEAKAAGRGRFAASRPGRLV